MRGMRLGAQAAHMYIGSYSLAQKLATCVVSTECSPHQQTRTIDGGFLFLSYHVSEYVTSPYYS